MRAATASRSRSGAKARFLMLSYSTAGRVSLRCSLLEISIRSAAGDWRSSTRWPNRGVRLSVHHPRCGCALQCRRALRPPPGEPNAVDDSPQNHSPRGGGPMVPREETSRLLDEFQELARCFRAYADFSPERVSSNCIRLPGAARGRTSKLLTRTQTLCGLRSGEAPANTRVSHSARTAMPNYCPVTVQSTAQNQTH